MRLYSTNGKAPEVNLRQAVVKGLAPDGGLYMPKELPVMPASFFQNLKGMTLPEIGFEVAKQLVDGELPDHDLQTIIEQALNFPIPLVEVEEGIYSLELYHGPTMAFKDVGARFMARLLSYFMQGEDKEVTILVATSGDTGSAVANGFLGVEGIKVVLLYPSGKVSHIQEQQLTTLGQNITALEVQGVFDDCQRMVKAAFADAELNQRLKLTTANSINIARLLPQSFYYYYGYAQMPEQDRVVVSVPSGNFGNLTAGLLAAEMGLPIKRFIAATNVNDVVPEYLSTGTFIPRASKPTFSNAMDVGDPSNFARMLDIYGHDHALLSKTIHGFSMDDSATVQEIRAVFNKDGYLLDPHGAIGYRALKNYVKDHGGSGFFIETAHPAKFKDVVEEATGQSVEIPVQLQAPLQKEKQSHIVSPDFDALKSFLMAN